MNKILDESYYDLIIRNILIPSYDTGDNITFLNRRDSLLHIPTGSPDPCDLGRNPFSSFPTLYTLTSAISLEKSGVSAVQQNPSLALSGQGILVAVIDTGIDYQHPAFKFNDGTSRILSMWDQTEQSGIPPEEFTFGSEYNREQINDALSSPDPLSVVPTTDSVGHGTAIASIIAGSPNEKESFSGVVPQSDFVIVKLKEAKQNLKNIFFVPEDILCYQESDIILGIRFARTVSEKFNRPLVICIAMGSSQDGHNGRGAVSDYIDFLALLPGIGVSVSAGNEGNDQRHYFQAVYDKPFYNDFELKIGEMDKMFSMQIWTDSITKLTVDVSSPNRESSRRVYPGLNECRKISFVLNQTILWINNITFEEETGEQLILIRFQDTVPGIWSLRIQGTQDSPFSFHTWLPSGDLISKETFFLNSNPNITITSPGNTRHVLTVTAYNQFNDSILNESSRGYAISGVIKPDLAAPGYQLPCAVPGNLYGTATGTGAGAAHAAGIIAMILEWAIIRENYPRITGNNVNRLLVSAAKRNKVFTYPTIYGDMDRLM